MSRIIKLVFFLSLIVVFNSNTHNFNHEPEKIKGVCWVAHDSIVLSNFNKLVENNIKWISQTPFFYQRGIDNPNIRYDNSRAHWAEQDEGLIETSLLAKQKGIKTILKPHIWITNANGKWRSDLAMNSAKDWGIWFNNYKNAILYYAEVARKGEMEAFCIGTELYIPATKFPEKWREIICEVRDIYPGQVTYAANFYKEYKEIEFWDDLDYIGVQGYFPLTKKETPDLSTLIESWKPHKKAMKKLSKKFNKKIVFTEIGYKNTTDAAHEPWLWPRQVKEDVEACEKTQANCYEAMFAANWEEDWFGGLFIWKWFHVSHKFTFEEYIEIRRKRRQARGLPARTGPSIGFTPQNSEAEIVMRNWFSEAN